MREFTSYMPWLTWTHHPWAAKVICYAMPTVPDSSLFFSSIWWNVPLFTSTTASLFICGPKKVAFWSWNLLCLCNCILLGLSGAFPLNDVRFLWKMSSFENRCERGVCFIHCWQLLGVNCCTPAKVWWWFHLMLFPLWLGLSVFCSRISG